MLRGLSVRNPRATLILQGRASSCIAVESFKYWTLNLAAPAGSYTCDGVLLEPEPDKN
jgi:hypothetical protein